MRERRVWVSSRRTKKTKKTQKLERDYTGDARDNWRRRGRRENSIDRNSSETFVCVLCVKKKYNVPARRRRTCCSRTRRRWPWFLFLLMKCVVCVCPFVCLPGQGQDKLFSYEILCMYVCSVCQVPVLVSSLLNFCNPAIELLLARTKANPGKNSG